MDVTECAAVVLAAGAGKRMGMPKALLSVDGEPLAVCQARHLDRAGFKPVHIVVGCALDHVLPSVSSWPHVAINEDWRLGQFSSIQVGIRASGDDCWVAILPVDIWCVAEETLVALRAHRVGGIDAVVPCFRKRRGHPPLLAPEFCRQIMALSPRSGRLDHALKRARVAELPVPDPAVLHNANRPQDIHW